MSEKVGIGDIIRAIDDPEVLGAIMRVARDTGILGEDKQLDEKSIKKTILTALGTQSFINKQLKNNKLYIETAENRRLEITKKPKS